MMSLIIYAWVTKQYKLVWLVINTQLGYNWGLLEMTIVIEILKRKYLSTKVSLEIPSYGI